MTTLENSYCVPQTKEEKSRFPHLDTENHCGVFYDSDYGVLCFDESEWIHSNGKEIPVQHFIDLVEDRITPWRIAELGFSRLVDGYQYIELGDCSIYVFAGTISFKIYVMPTSEFAEDIRAYITTFTDLLTLIKFLKPQTK